jgi:hypothetical protein
LPLNGLVHGFRPLAARALDLVTNQVPGHLKNPPAQIAAIAAPLKMLMQAEERLLNAIAGIVVRQPQAEKVAVEWVTKLVEEPGYFLHVVFSQGEQQPVGGFFRLTAKTAS